MFVWIAPSGQIFQLYETRQCKHIIECDGYVGMCGVLTILTGR